MKVSLFVFLLGMLVIFGVMFRIFMIACSDPKDYGKHKHETKFLAKVFIASVISIVFSVVVSCMAVHRH